MKLIRTFILFLLITTYPTFILAEEKASEYKLDNAVRLFHEASYNKAIDEIKTFYSDEKDVSSLTLDASYLLGMSYRALGDWNEAASWLQKASKHSTLADYVLFRLGEVYAGSGNYQSAFDTFQALHKKFPESRWKEEASFKASDALFQLGRYSEAGLSFGRFIEENPKNILISKAFLKTAECIEKEGKIEEAYNKYKTVWLRFPSSPESRISSERMSQISLNTTLPHPSPDERYKRISNMFSNNGYKEGINELIPLLKEVERNGAERPDWYDEGILKLGNAYYQIREDEKTINAIGRISETSSSPKILKEASILKGKALQRSGKRVEAFDSFSRIANDFPKEDVAASAIYRMADMSEGDGDTEKAKLLYKRLYADFPNSSLADDALWKEGWLTYLGNDPKGAHSLFKKLLTEYPSSEFADTASYWSGRTAEKLGANDEAVSFYAGIMNKFPMSYYATLSRARLSYMASDRPLSVLTKKASSTIPVWHRQSDANTSLHLKKGRALLELGFREDAAAELSLAESICSDKGTILEIARLMAKAGDYHRAKRMILNAFQEYLREDIGKGNEEIWAFAFPSGFSDYVSINAERNSLSPSLVYAIIREESSYKLDAVSRAGAIGLMQLMPYTGNSISKEIGFKGYSTNSLYRPEVNITLGTSYLKKVIESHKGNLPLAIASYNAGPNVVATWVSRYGTSEMDEFIEKIPYSETRNYVKKVLRSYDMYERLYSAGKSEASGKLAANDNP